MRMRNVLLFSVALLVACKSGAVNDGYALDLTLLVDSTVSGEDLANAQTLDLEVSGAETYSNPQIPVAGKFSATARSAKIRYKPGQTSGTIAITVTLADGAGARIATGSLPSVSLGGGTQLLTLSLAKTSDGGSDGGVAATDMMTCGDGVVDATEQCDPGPGSPKPCPTSMNDCDDHDPCTTDGLTGSGCQAACTHTSLPNSTGCMMGTVTGVCLSGACCTGCIKNGVCLAGTSDAKSCGSGGNSCFDCTQNAATATCNGGNCSGCDATSCTTEGRTCGTSSCGYNCGGCADGCSNGSLTHYACVNKTCQMNGSGNCGLYAACATSSTCATTCAGDNGCVATAWCGNNVCKPKVATGGTCSAETTGDHECASPNVCSWNPTGSGGYCVPTRCSGCAAASPTGCNDYIKYGYDPRNACQGYSPTACHQNYCAGFSGDPTSPNPPACDYGLDATGENGRPCGAVSCTNNAQGVGVLTGNLCQITNQCKAGQTNTCSDGFRTCYPCNSAHNDCDLNAGFSC